ncbi:MAG: insulinase family protein [Bdellovibrionaceae bacterium]|nr:insulinase family protein [Pseudobdellovibrionaceae bacterium]
MIQSLFALLSACVLHAQTPVGVSANQTTTTNPVPQARPGGLKPVAPTSLRLEFPVEKFQLANGLTVILHQDRSVPLISYHTWYRVGSRDEKPGITGAAHMLEHMMFKGAKKYSNKDFDRILQENGITNNAFTTWDYTGYYENLPSSKLELIMDVEVDRMRHLALKAEDLKSELEVVKEERRWRIDNNPPSLLREAMFNALFKPHPYNWPVIGTMDDIAAYTTDKLRPFYDTFYVPNNAVLVLAGDFDIPSTKKLIERHYGVLERRELPARSYAPAAEPKKAERFTVEAEVQNSTVIIGYKGVESGHPDSFALDLAAAVLGAGDSSRLYKKLVYRDQTATSAGGYNITNADPGAFMVLAAMKPGLKTAGAEKILREEVLRLQKELVTETELQKVKNQLMKDYIDGLTTIDGKAQALATNEILFGSFEKLFTDLEKYKAVTVKDIQRVAQKYLRTEREIVGILNPRARQKASVQ